MREESKKSSTLVAVKGIRCLPQSRALGDALMSH